MERPREAVQPTGHDKPPQKSEVVASLAVGRSPTAMGGGGGSGGSAHRLIAPFVALRCGPLTPTEKRICSVAFSEEAGAPIANGGGHSRHSPRSSSVRRTRGAAQIPGAGAQPTKVSVVSLLRLSGGRHEDPLGPSASDAAAVRDVNGPPGSAVGLDSGPGDVGRTRLQPCLLVDPTAVRFEPRQHPGAGPAPVAARAGATSDIPTDTPQHSAPEEQPHGWPQQSGGPSAPAGPGTLVVRYRDATGKVREERLHGDYVHVAQDVSETSAYFHDVRRERRVLLDYVASRKFRVAGSSASESRASEAVAPGATESRLPTDARGVQLAEEEVFPALLRPAEPLWLPLREFGEREHAPRRVVDDLTGREDDGNGGDNDDDDSDGALGVMDVAIRSAVEQVTFSDAVARGVSAGGALSSRKGTADATAKLASGAADGGLRSAAELAAAATTTGVAQLLLQGRDATVVAIGPPQTGKTHSLYGTEKTGGVVPAVLDHLCRELLQVMRKLRVLKFASAQAARVPPERPLSAEAGGRRPAVPKSSAALAGLRDVELSGPLIQLCFVAFAEGAVENAVMPPSLPPVSGSPPRPQHPPSVFAPGTLVLPVPERHRLGGVDENDEINDLLSVPTTASAVYDLFNPASFHDGIAGEPMAPCTSTGVRRLWGCSGEDATDEVGATGDPWRAESAPRLMLRRLRCHGHGRTATAAPPAEAVADGWGLSDAFTFTVEGGTWLEVPLADGELPHGYGTIPPVAAKGGGARGSGAAHPSAVLKEWIRRGLEHYKLAALTHATRMAGGPFRSSSSVPDPECSSATTSHHHLHLALLMRVCFPGHEEELDGGPTGSGRTANAVFLEINGHSVLPPAPGRDCDAAHFFGVQMPMGPVGGRVALHGGAAAADHGGLRRGRGWGSGLRTRSACAGLLGSALRGASRLFVIATVAPSTLRAAEGAAFLRLVAAIQARCRPPARWCLPSSAASTEQLRLEVDALREVLNRLDALGLTAARAGCDSAEMEYLQGVYGVPRRTGDGTREEDWRRRLLLRELVLLTSQVKSTVTPLCERLTAQQQHMDGWSTAVAQVQQVLLRMWLHEAAQRDGRRTGMTPASYLSHNLGLALHEVLGHTRNFTWRPPQGAPHPRTKSLTPVRPLHGSPSSSSSSSSLLVVPLNADADEAPSRVRAGVETVTVADPVVLISYAFSASAKLPHQGPRSGAGAPHQQSLVGPALEQAEIGGTALTTLLPSFLTLDAAMGTVVLRFTTLPVPAPLLCRPIYVSNAGGSGAVGGQGIQPPVSVAGAGATPLVLYYLPLPASSAVSAFLAESEVPHPRELGTSSSVNALVDEPLVVDVCLRQRPAWASNDRQVCVRVKRWRFVNHGGGTASGEWTATAPPPPPPQQQQQHRPSGRKNTSARSRSPSPSVVEDGPRTPRPALPIDLSSSTSSASSSLSVPLLAGESTVTPPRGGAVAAQAQAGASGRQSSQLPAWLHTQLPRAVFLNGVPLPWIVPTRLRSILGKAKASLQPQPPQHLQPLSVGFTDASPHPLQRQRHEVDALGCEWVPVQDGSTLLVGPYALVLLCHGAPPLASPVTCGLLVADGDHTVLQQGRRALLGAQQRVLRTAWCMSEVMERLALLHFHQARLAEILSVSLGSSGGGDDMDGNSGADDGVEILGAKARGRARRGSPGSGNVASRKSSQFRLAQTTAAYERMRTRWDEIEEVDILTPLALLTQDLYTDLTRVYSAYATFCGCPQSYAGPGPRQAMTATLPGFRQYVQEVVCDAEARATRLLREARASLRAEAGPRLSEAQVALRDDLNALVARVTQAKVEAATSARQHTFLSRLFASAWSEAALTSFMARLTSPDRRRDPASRGGALALMPLTGDAARSGQYVSEGDDDSEIELLVRQHRWGVPLTRANMTGQQLLASVVNAEWQQQRHISGSGGDRRAVPTMSRPGQLRREKFLLETYLDEHIAEYRSGRRQDTTTPRIRRGRPLDDGSGNIVVYPLVMQLPPGSLLSLAGDPQPPPAGYDTNSEALTDRSVEVIPGMRVEVPGAYDNDHESGEDREKHRLFLKAYGGPLRPIADLHEVELTLLMSPCRQCGKHRHPTELMWLSLGFMTSAPPIPHRAAATADGGLRSPLLRLPSLPALPAGRDLRRVVCLPEEVNTASVLRRRLPLELLRFFLEVQRSRLWKPSGPSVWEHCAEYNNLLIGTALTFQQAVDPTAVMPWSPMDGSRNLSATLALANRARRVTFTNLSSTHAAGASFNGGNDSAAGKRKGPLLPLNQPTPHGILAISSTSMTAPVAPSTTSAGGAVVSPEAPDVALATSQPVTPHQQEQQEQLLSLMQQRKADKGVQPQLPGAQSLLANSAADELRKTELDAAVGVRPRFYDSRSLRVFGFMRKLRQQNSLWGKRGDNYVFDAVTVVLRGHFLYYFYGEERPLLSTTANGGCYVLGAKIVAITKSMMEQEAAELAAVERASVVSPPKKRKVPIWGGGKAKATRDETTGAVANDDGVDKGANAPTSARTAGLSEQQVAHKRHLVATLEAASQTSAYGGEDGAASTDGATVRGGPNQSSSTTHPGSLWRQDERQGGMRYFIEVIPSTPRELAKNTLFDTKLNHVMLGFTSRDEWEAWKIRLLTASLPAVSSDLRRRYGMEALEEAATDLYISTQLARYYPQQSPQPKSTRKVPAEEVEPAGMSQPSEKTPVSPRPSSGLLRSPVSSVGSSSAPPGLGIAANAPLLAVCVREHDNFRSGDVLQLSQDEVCRVRVLRRQLKVRSLYTKRVLRQHGEAAADLRDVLWAPVMTESDMVARRLFQLVSFHSQRKIEGYERRQQQDTGSFDYDRSNGCEFEEILGRGSSLPRAAALSLPVRGSKYLLLCALTSASRALVGPAAARRLAYEVAKLTEVEHKWKVQRERECQMLRRIDVGQSKAVRRLFAHVAGTDSSSDSSCDEADRCEEPVDHSDSDGSAQGDATARSAASDPLDVLKSSGGSAAASSKKSTSRKNSARRSAAERNGGDGRSSSSTSTASGHSSSNSRGESPAPGALGVASTSRGTASVGTAGSATSSATATRAQEVSEGTHHMPSAAVSRTIGALVAPSLVMPLDSIPFSNYLRHAFVTLSVPMRSASARRRGNRRHIPPATVFAEDANERGNQQGEPTMRGRSAAYEGGPYGSLATTPLERRGMADNTSRNSVDTVIRTRARAASNPGDWRKARRKMQHVRARQLAQDREDIQRFINQVKGGGEEDAAAVGAPAVETEKHPRSEADHSVSSTLSSSLSDSDHEELEPRRRKRTLSYHAPFRRSRLLNVEKIITERYASHVWWVDHFTSTISCATCAPSEERSHVRRYIRSSRFQAFELLYAGREDDRAAASIFSVAPSAMRKAAMVARTLEGAHGIHGNGSRGPGPMDDGMSVLPGDPAKRGRFGVVLVFLRERQIVFRDFFEDLAERERFLESILLMRPTVRSYCPPLLDRTFDELADRLLPPSRLPDTAPGGPSAAVPTAPSPSTGAHASPIHRESMVPTGSTRRGEPVGLRSVMATAEEMEGCKFWLHVLHRMSLVEAASAHASSATATTALMPYDGITPGAPDAAAELQGADASLSEMEHTDLTTATATAAMTGAGGGWDSWTALQPRNGVASGEEASGMDSPSVALVSPRQRDRDVKREARQRVRDHQRELRRLQRSMYRNVKVDAQGPNSGVYCTKKIKGLFPCLGRTTDISCIESSCAATTEPASQPLPPSGLQSRRMSVNPNASFTWGAESFADSMLLAPSQVGSDVAGLEALLRKMDQLDDKDLDDLPGDYVNVHLRGTCGFQVTSEPTMPLTVWTGTLNLSGLPLQSANAIDSWLLQLLPHINDTIASSTPAGGAGARGPFEGLHSPRSSGGATRLARKRQEVRHVEDSVESFLLHGHLANGGAAAELGASGAPRTKKGQTLVHPDGTVSQLVTPVVLSAAAATPGSGSSNNAKAPAKHFDLVAITLQDITLKVDQRHSRFMDFLNEHFERNGYVVVGTSSLRDNVVLAVYARRNIACLVGAVTAKELPSSMRMLKRKERGGVVVAVEIGMSKVCFLAVYLPTQASAALVDDVRVTAQCLMTQELLSGIPAGVPVQLLNAERGPHAPEVPTVAAAASPVRGGPGRRFAPSLNTGVGRWDQSAAATQIKATVLLDNPGVWSADALAFYDYVFMVGDWGFPLLLPEAPPAPEISRDDATRSPGPLSFTAPLEPPAVVEPLPTAEGAATTVMTPLVKRTAMELFASLREAILEPASLCDTIQQLADAVELKILLAREAQRQQVIAASMMSMMRQSIGGVAGQSPSRGGGGGGDGPIAMGMCSSSSAFDGENVSASLLDTMVAPSPSALFFRFRDCLPMAFRAALNGDGTAIRRALWTATSASIQTRLKAVSARILAFANNHADALQSFDPVLWYSSALIQRSDVLYALRASSLVLSFGVQEPVIAFLPTARVAVGTTRYNLRPLHRKAYSILQHRRSAPAPVTRPMEPLEPGQTSPLLNSPPASQPNFHTGSSPASPQPDAATRQSPMGWSSSGNPPGEPSASAPTHHSSSPGEAVNVAMGGGAAARSQALGNQNSRIPANLMALPEQAAQQKAELETSFAYSSRIFFKNDATWNRLAMFAPNDSVERVHQYWHFFFGPTAQLAGGGGPVQPDLDVLLGLKESSGVTSRDHRGAGPPAGWATPSARNAQAAEAAALLGHGASGTGRGHQELGNPLLESILSSSPRAAVAAGAVATSAAGKRQLRALRHGLEDGVNGSISDLVISLMQRRPISERILVHGYTSVPPILPPARPKRMKKADSRPDTATSPHSRAQRRRKAEERLGRLKARRAQQLSDEGSAYRSLLVSEYLPVSAAFTIHIRRPIVSGLLWSRPERWQPGDQQFWFVRILRVRLELPVDEDVIDVNECPAAAATGNAARSAPPGRNAGRSRSLPGSEGRTDLRSGSLLQEVWQEVNAEAGENADRNPSRRQPQQPQQQQQPLEQSTATPNKESAGAPKRVRILIEETKKKGAADQLGGVASEPSADAWFSLSDGGRSMQRRQRASYPLPDLLTSLVQQVERSEAASANGCGSDSDGGESDPVGSGSMSTSLPPSVSGAARASNADCRQTSASLVMQSMPQLFPPRHFVDQQHCTISHHLRREQEVLPDSDLFHSSLNDTPGTAPRVLLTRKTLEVHFTPLPGQRDIGQLELLPYSADYLMHCKLLVSVLLESKSSYTGASRVADGTRVEATGRALSGRGGQERQSTLTHLHGTTPIALYDVAQAAIAEVYRRRGVTSPAVGDALRSRGFASTQVSDNTASGSPPTPLAADSQGLRAARDSAAHLADARPTLWGKRGEGGRSTTTNDNVVVSMRLPLLRAGQLVGTMVVDLTPIMCREEPDIL